MSSSKATQPVDAADDLDDLDDILDEFNDKKPVTVASSREEQGEEATSSSSSAQPTTFTSALAGDAVSGNGEVGETEEEMNERFAKELAVGMEALMKGLGGGPDGTGQADPGLSGDGLNKDAIAGAGSENLFNEEEMMKQFEQMMADMGLGGLGGVDGFPGAPGPIKSSASETNSPQPSASAGSSANPPPAPANFQEAIRSTMSRLRESDASASSNTGGAGDSMDLEKLMATLGGAEGMEGEEGIAKMLESMMGELMSKDVLYEPLKELKDKYPDYLANPPKPLSDEDRSRYEAQSRIVTQVIAIFDDNKFENGTEVEKTALKAKVQTLMNEMQDNGAPPSEIVGDLPPELENMPGLGNDENCSIM